MVGPVKFDPQDFAKILREEEGQPVEYVQKLSK
jgi:hypothetical protein